MPKSTRRKRNAIAKKTIKERTQKEKTSTNLCGSGIIGADKLKLQTKLLQISIWALSILNQKYKKKKKGKSGVENEQKQEECKWMLFIWSCTHTTINKTTQILKKLVKYKELKRVGVSLG